MKKLSVLILLFVPALLFAQEQATGSLTIFSENGAAFYVFLDGKKQNDIAGTNVRITNLEDLYYNTKIVFADPFIAPVVKNNLPVSDADDVMKDVSYRIRLDKAGSPRLHFYSMLNVVPDFVPPAGTYVYRLNQPSSGVIARAPKQLPITPSTGQGALNIFSKNGENFYLFLDGIKQNDTARSNIYVGKLSHAYYNVKIVFPASGIPDIAKNNVPVADADGILMSVSYRIRKDKAGKSKLNFYSIGPVEENVPIPAGMFVYQYADDIPAKVNVAVKVASTANMVAAKKDEPVPVTTAVVCNGWPMARSEFAAAKQMIEDAAGDAARLSAAKNIARENCLLASQVSQVCKVLGSEKLQIAFAKFAYRYTIDAKNYADVINGLSSDAGKKELAKFIKGG